MKGKFEKKIDELHVEEKFLTRHIVSRLSHGLFAVASVITRLWDFAVGLLAASLAFATLGKIETINHLAYRGLKVGGLCSDVFEHTIKAINPWTGEIPPNS